MAKKDRRTPAPHTHAQYGTLFIWEQTAQGVAEVKLGLHISTSVFFFINQKVETVGALHILHIAWKAVVKSGHGIASLKQ